LKGQRQIVFVTGEPGIGKTTLIDAFLQNLESHDPNGEENQKAKIKRQKAKIKTDSRSPLPVAWIARGQCVEHYGTGEPYMPVLEALGRLCRIPEGQRLKDVLTQYAPTWLAQLPALLSTAELQALQPRVLGATHERMLREFAEALEVLTTEHMVILVVEDLHWADVSTLELLAALARRRESARLLVIGTYRPTEMMEDNHPLNSVVRELYAHRLGAELALGLLSEEDVAAYLRRRFPHSVLPSRLARVLYHCTEGNPLFLVSVVGDLLARNMIEQVDGNYMFQGNLESLAIEAPESIRHLVARQRERLALDERRVLEAASVAGLEFSTASVAAALATEITRIEERCAGLAERQQFLRPVGVAEWPDGIVAARYGFIHALYQHLWHERVSIEQQQRWHLRIGERKEAAYGPRAPEIATELAVHFEQGRDYPRAIRSLQQAGENALRRSANQEAIAHLNKGIALLHTLPDSSERTWRELTLRVTLGAPLLISKGYTAPEVRRTYTRAYRLCQQVGESPQLFPALFGLFRYYLLHAQLRTARELAERLVRLARQEPEPLFLPAAYAALGAVLFHLGEFSAAREAIELGVAGYDRRLHGPLAFQYGEDAGVICQDFAAWVLHVLGYSDLALTRTRAAFALAQDLSHPYTLGGHCGAMAIFSQCRRESTAVQEQTRTAIRLLTAQESGPGWVTFASILQGWALATRGQSKEGIAQTIAGLQTLETGGVSLWLTFFLGLLAEAYKEACQVEKGLHTLHKALTIANSTGQHWYDAELYRLKGELTLTQSNVQSLKSEVTNPRPRPPDPQGEAEACFHKALEIARRQQAKSFELRAAMSLARLWQRQGKQHEAQPMLGEIYDWFTEGFDTKDLQEAKTLIEELSS
jgi:predicted ATPase